MSEITADELRLVAQAMRGANPDTAVKVLVGVVDRAADALDAADVRIKFLERVWEVTDAAAYDASCRDAVEGRRLVNDLLSSLEVRSRGVSTFRTDLAEALAAWAAGKRVNP